MAATMGESSSSSPKPTNSKPVVVRVKRKPNQSPLDAFWLEINERPLKRPLLDFGNLSISDSSHKEESNTKKVFVQRVETISRSEVTFDIVQSFVEPDSSNALECKSRTEERKHFFKRENENKHDQLLSKAKQKQESLAKNARFKQIWKSRKGNRETVQDKSLQEICHFYDVIRVDGEKKSMEVQQEEISLEDQRLLSSYLPLLREFIPDAAVEVESDLHAHSKQEDYVYDIYTVKDEVDMIVDDSSYSYPLVQVDDGEDYYDGPDFSDFESDDSNAEDNPLNDYPDEISEEEDGEESKDSDYESEENGLPSAGNESSGCEEDRDGGADPLYDEDFDDDYGVVDYDVDDEDWRWSYR